MKITQYITLSAAVLGLVASCGKLDHVTAPNPADTKAPKLTKSPDVTVINAENEQSGKTTFEWQAADYGVQTMITYSVMVSIGGGKPALLATSNTTSAEVTYKTLNETAIAAGALTAKEGETPIANDITFTVTSLLTEKYAPALVSAGVAAKLTAYMPPPAYLRIAGTLDFPAAWQPENPKAPRLTRPKPDQSYEGMVDLNSAEGLKFKFCAQPNWNGPNYGGSKDALDPDGGDIADLEGAYYRLVVDKDVKKVTTALKIETIGVIGDAFASGWDSETEKMVYEQETNTWTIASIAMEKGKEFKLRINENWSHAIGGELDAATFAGGNFKTTGEGGNYKIVLNASLFPYTITLTKL